MLYSGRSAKRNPCSLSIPPAFALLTVCLISTVQCLPKVFRSNEICGVYNGHRVYFELGDRGQLQATNVSVPYIPRTALVNQTFVPSVCTLELVTCPSCNFKISLSYSNFPAKCSVHNEPPCRCDYLEFTEPPFDSTEYTGRRNCGHDVIYQTQTRSVLIKFVYWSNHSHAFTLDYVAERNRETIQANPGPAQNITSSNNYLHHRIISTPYFPSYYPRDFGKEYVLSCNVEACRINVIFSDFQLAKTSTMEFYDWNGQRLGAVSGAIFRPPVFQSTGPSMIIRFYANGGSALGYRALVSFLHAASASDVALHPNTNCGGVVENIGGAITMMKMLDNANETRIYDCVWLIKPPNTYAHLKTHLSLKVDTFEKLGPHSMLSIIQGTTSDGTLLSVTRADSALVRKDLVVPLTSGFYVHLRASFGHLSRLALVYAGFSYLDCYMGTEYLCQNRKCIPIQLHCDGFDHCGDNSDEPESCVQEWSSGPLDRRWYAHTPNYYFPKMDRYPDLRTATIIFIASSLGLIMLISALIVLLYRTGNRARQQRELQSQLQTISELLDSNNTHGAEELDDPPVYEAPPDYDEIIKVGMDEEMKRKRRRRSSSSTSGRRSRMRRSRRQSNTSEVHNPILEVQLPPESDSLPSSSTGYSMGVGDHAHPDSDAYDRYSDADIDEEDHDLRLASWSNLDERADFFISSRILETAASSAGPSQSVGSVVSSQSSPPPTYDQSNARFFALHSAALSATTSSTPDGGVSGSHTEVTAPITVAVNYQPMGSSATSVDSTTHSPSSTITVPGMSFAINCDLMSNDQNANGNNGNTTTTSSTTITTNTTTSNSMSSSSNIETVNRTILPTPIWNGSTQTERPWQMFGGSLDEPRLDRLQQQPQQQAPSSNLVQNSFNSLDIDQMQEIDAYLFGYSKGASNERGISSGSSQETIDSNRTMQSQLTASASFVGSSCLCDSTNSQPQNQPPSITTTCAPTSSSSSYDMMRQYCPVCQEQHQAADRQLHSTRPPPPPAAGPTAPSSMYCSNCNGRIVTVDYLQMVRNGIERGQQTSADPVGSGTFGKVCSCVAKFPSQGNITRPTSAVGMLLTTRTFSVDQLDDGAFAGGSFGNDRRSIRSSCSAVSRFDAYFNAHFGTTNNDRQPEA